jgi:hypothetical protein
MLPDSFSSFFPKKTAFTLQLALLLAIRVITDDCLVVLFGLQRKLPRQEIMPIFQRKRRLGSALTLLRDSHSNGVKPRQYSPMSWISAREFLDFRSSQLA